MSSLQTTVPTTHLICNAHLDPVWLWNWQEGAAAALATFRSAAELCAEHPGFVFNHNEALLYQWVQEYEPVLFARLQALVQSGQWKIMGGWFLQPDCNLPHPEALLRQILHGREWFARYFGSTPRTAVNFDSFGHSRGLIQLLRQTGFTSYLFCRPMAECLDLPGENFRWIGYDGSEVTALRSLTHYNTPLGGAAEKLDEFLQRFGDRPHQLFLWGVGNHGGGPSRRDLADLAKRRQQVTDRDLRHSTPDAYFAELDPEKLSLWQDSIRPFAVGCYTSMQTVKRAYRELEAEFLLTEKLAACVHARELHPWPETELVAAERDLLFLQFHDILPGSCVPSAEAAALRQAGHARFILETLRARLLFAWTGRFRKAIPGDIPIFAINPHPWSVRTLCEIELNMEDFHYEPASYTVEIRDQQGRLQPAQLEKEESNLPMDWRKKVVFSTTLPGSSCRRFSCHFKAHPPRRKTSPVRRGVVRIQEDNDRLQLDPGRATILQWTHDRQPLLSAPGFRLVVLEDTPDPWVMTNTRFDKVLGHFTPTPEGQSRLVESGPVRTVHESILEWGKSRAIFRLATGPGIPGLDCEIELHWWEEDKFLKLEIPLADRIAEFYGQDMGGVARLPEDGTEAVFQRWCMVRLHKGKHALSCLNRTIYGGSLENGLWRINLLRSPAHAAFDRPERTGVVPGRHTPRIDQGVHTFQFRFTAGPFAQRSAAVDREATLWNEKPLLVSHFPDGPELRDTPGLEIRDKVVQLWTARPARTSQGWMLRLFEPTGTSRKTRVVWPDLRLDTEVRLPPFAIINLLIRPDGSYEQTNALEESSP